MGEIHQNLAVCVCVDSVQLVFAQVEPAAARPKLNRLLFDVLDATKFAIQNDYSPLLLTRLLPRVYALISANAQTHLHFPRST